MGGRVVRDHRNNEVAKEPLSLTPTPFRSRPRASAHPRTSRELSRGLGRGRSPTPAPPPPASRRRTHRGPGPGVSFRPGSAGAGGGDRRAWSRASEALAGPRPLGPRGERAAGRGAPALDPRRRLEVQPGSDAGAEATATRGGGAVRDASQGWGRGLGRRQGEPGRGLGAAPFCLDPRGPGPGSDAGRTGLRQRGRSAARRVVGVDVGGGCVPASRACAPARGLEA